MQLSDIEHFKDLLVERSRNLSDWINSAGATNASEVEKVRSLLHQIRDALDRIECESYGICKVCQEEIEIETLELRPEAEICIDCLSNSEKETLENDLHMAGKIQRALLPQALPTIQGFSVSARWLPAGEVGGDYYDFLPCSGNESSRIIIADAMGKGVSAGIVMSSLQGVLRVLSSDIRSPGPLITRLNQWLCRNVPVTKFISLACLCLEQTSDEKALVTYANAGHCPPILCRKDGSIERLDVTGGVLGVHEDFTYGEKKLSMNSGDLLMLYTDGVTEVTNGHDEMFDDSRLVEFIQNRGEGPFESMIDNLIKELKNFSRMSNGIHDDLTVVSLLKL
jgi:sigma-B regulation protein RsbU (phosphoserine phosphatase)